MSCYTSAGGTLVMRLARAYSKLPEPTLQKLFHSLKREGAKLPEPTAADRDLWRARQLTLINHAPLTPGKKERSEADLFRASHDPVDPGMFYAWQNLEVRARQEAVLRDMKGTVVDLDPPGSQAALYDLDEEGRPREVWYASYGSNLNRDRLLSYVQGGTPPGSTVVHQGCRDRTPPEEDIPIRFEGRMHFAAKSGRWNGGVAFMDNDHAGHALGRAYRISMEQFEDVVAQENGKLPGTVNIDTTEVLKNQSADVVTTLYGRLVHIGDHDGAPVFTFTGSFSASDALHDAHDEKALSWTATTKPSPNYLRMIGSGLAETFNMDVSQQADYLRGAPGATTMTKTRLKKILSTPPDPVVAKPLFSSSPLTGGSEPRGYTPTWSSGRYESAYTNQEEPLGNEDMWDGIDTFVPSDYDKHPSWLHDPYFSGDDEGDPEAPPPRPEPQKKRKRATSRTETDEERGFRVIKGTGGPVPKGTPKPAGIPSENARETPPPGQLWIRKQCVICHSRDHDMHGCPELASPLEPAPTRKSAKTPAKAPVKKATGAQKASPGPSKDAQKTTQVKKKPG